MAQGELPPQLKEQIERFQNLQQQLAAIAQQKAAYEAQAKEFERANEAVSDLDEDADVYRNVGAFLVKTKGKSAVVSEIAEESETLGVRIKNLERQESRLKESVTELQSKIENALARMQGRGGEE